MDFLTAQNLPALVVAVSCIGMAAGFMLLLFALRSRPALWAWTGSLWLTAASLATTTLYTGTALFSLSALTTLMEVVAGVFLLKGVALHVGRNLPIKWPLLIAATVALAVVILNQIRPLSSAGMLISVISGAVFYIWMVVLLRSPPEGQGLSYRLAAAVFVFNLLSSTGGLVAGLAQVGAQNIALIVAMVCISVLGLMIQCFALMLLLVEEMLSELRLRASTDGLTGLLNRSTMLSQGMQELAVAMNVNRPFSLLIIDLDHFKRINDTYGHPGGDAVLRGFAQLLRESSPPMALSGRYGGEEFVVILPGMDGSEAMALAQAIVLKTRDMAVATHAGTARFTVSIGVCAARQGNTLGHLLGQADAALYMAKAAGRDQACLSSNVIDPLDAQEIDVFAACGP